MSSYGHLMVTGVVLHIMLDKSPLLRYEHISNFCILWIDTKYGFSFKKKRKNTFISFLSFNNNASENSYEYRPSFRDGVLLDMILTSSMRSDNVLPLITDHYLVVVRFIQRLHFQ